MLKVTTNFSGDVHFLHAFHLKFTLNVNIVYIPVEATFSTSIVNHDNVRMTNYIKSPTVQCHLSATILDATNGHRLHRGNQ